MTENACILQLMQVVFQLTDLNIFNFIMYDLLKGKIAIYD